MRLGAVACVLLCAVPAFAQQQQLVPANFTRRTDSQGFLWDVGQLGSIDDGSNDCFDGAAELNINGDSFNVPPTPMMTPDGSEYVLSGQIAGLGVTRRVKVDVKAAAVRYVEVINNPGPSPVTVHLSLATSMGRGPGLAMVTDSGTPAGGVLGNKDQGVILVGQARNMQHSVVFHLAGPGSKVKPAIYNQSNYQFAFTYTVNVPPGKTVSILHGMAQRRLASVPSAKAAADLFKPFNERAWLRDLPREVRRTIVNLGRLGFADAGLLLTLESLGVEQQADDVLAVGEKTRLRGKATCKTFQFQTSYGKLTLPFEKIVAVAGQRFTGQGSRVFLADGQVLNGEIHVEGLRFAMNSGLDVELRAGSLDRLVMRRRPDDGKPADDVVAMVETIEGDRLALRETADQQVAATTPWGERHIPLEEIERLFAAEDRIGHHLVLRDGSRLFAYVSDSALSLNTLLFGPQEFLPPRIRRLTAGAVPSAEEGMPAELAVPHLLLVGENRLVGPVDLAAVHFLSAGQRIPVPPNQIRLLRSVGDEAGADGAQGPRFEAELWDGGTLRGELDEAVLPVRWGEGEAQVPVRDVIEIRVPTPSVPDTVRARIAQLIRDLGHPEYAKRKAAKEALAELGQLPKLQLDETLRQTTDPEVRRSVEALLEEIR